MSAAARPLRTAVVLARSCHPAPCVAVTVFATVLAVLAGNGATRCLLLAAAVLAGQLSIGWSNDRVDAARDRLAGRRDKPFALGEVRAPVVDAAIVCSLIATLGLSFALGLRAGLLHCGAVACGWAYNLGLKRSWLSFLPYALAFGALPAIATLALPHPRLPGAWVVIPAAALGVVANLTNSLPDLQEDARTGVRGLPHRLGARGSVLTASGLLLGATAVLVLARPGTPSSYEWVGLAVLIALVLALTPWVLRHPLDRRVFLGLIGLVALQFALIVSSAHRLR